MFHSRCGLLMMPTVIAPFLTGSSRHGVSAILPLSSERRNLVMRGRSAPHTVDYCRSRCQPPRSRQWGYLLRFIKRRRTQVNPIAILNRINSSSTQLTEILNSAFNVINGCRYTVNEWSLGLPKRAISPSVSQTSARQTSQMIAGQQSKTRKVKRSRV